MTADSKYLVELTDEEYNTIYNALLLNIVSAKIENNTAELKDTEAALTALQMAQYNR